jgi:twitching motility protein PilT
MDFDLVVRVAVEKGASDIFFKEANRPCLKVRGRIAAIDLPPLTAEDTKQIAYEMMSEDQIKRFERTHEMDMGITIPDLVRFRVNIHQQRGSIGIVMRLIDLDVPTIDALGLPEVLKDLCKRQQGLILVTGPTGCGKSTTLAAMLDEINSKQPVHIVTIEDPLEYVHRDKRGIVTQREVGIDTEGFHTALKTVLRQAPNIILIGEMRDVETMHAAMQAAETGHLVFSTVHTRSASETVERVLNMFPPHEKEQISLRMSQSLQGVISQKLVRTADGQKRLAALEVMVVTPTIQKYIEEARISEMYDAISEGEFWGMQTMNQVLDRYFKQGLISEETALANAGNLTELRQMLRRQA